jgi:glutathione S-transferase
MSQITLFGSRLSPFVEKVARALQLKRLGFREVDVKSPFDLRRWNPTTGKMPVLELDGERIYDSTFILRRLDEVAPEPPLFAEDPATAAAQRLLEDWSDESLYWYLMALRWAKPNAAATIEQITGSVPSLLRPLVAPLIARQIGSTTRAQGLGRLPYDVLIHETGRVLDDLVTLLGRRPFFYADRISAADLAIYGELRAGLSGPTPDFAALVSERPALADHTKRVEDATSA